MTFDSVIHPRNLSIAKKRELKFLAITDHTGKMPGTASDAYFAGDVGGFDFAFSVLKEAEMPEELVLMLMRFALQNI